MEFNYTGVQKYHTNYLSVMIHFMLICTFQFVNNKRNIKRYPLLSFMVAYSHNLQYLSCYCSNVPI